MLREDGPERLGTGGARRIGGPAGIAYFAHFTGNVWVMNADGTNAHEILANERVSGYTPPPCLSCQTGFEGGLQ